MLPHAVYEAADRQMQSDREAGRRSEPTGTAFRCVLKRRSIMTERTSCGVHWTVVQLAEYWVQS